MGYDIERRGDRTDATAPLAARPGSAARYLNPGMTFLVSAGLVGEGLRLANDAGFAMGGAGAGATIAAGALGTILGLTWLRWVHQPH